MRNFCVLALIAAFVPILTFAGLNFVQLARQNAVFPLNKFYYRMDYLDFRIAGDKIFEGKNIYTDRRYVAPPAGAVILAPLSLLSFKNASCALSAFILLSALAVIFMAAGSFFDFIKPHDAIYRQNLYIAVASVVFIFAFSYPFYFLFERGNIDWMVLLFFWAGIFALRKKYDIPAGTLFGLSVCLKVYPAIVIIPLFIYKKWKSVTSLAITVILVAAIKPSLWHSYFQALLTNARTEYFRPDENISLANTLFYVFKFCGANINENRIITVSYILFLILLAVISIYIYKKKEFIGIAGSIILIIPYFLMLPGTAYAYEAVFLIPAILYYCYVYANSVRYDITVLCYIAVTGIVMTQTQVIMMEKLSGLTWVHCICPFGVVLTAAANIFLSGRLHKDL